MDETARLSAFGDAIDASEAEITLVGSVRTAETVDSLPAMPVTGHRVSAPPLFDLVAVVGDARRAPRN